MADPGYVVVSFAWWPLDCLGRLEALRLLLRRACPEAGPWRPTRAALGSTLASEILLSLRCAAWALLGLIPAMVVFSLVDPVRLEQGGVRLALAALAAAGLLPAAYYAFARLLAPLELLRAPLGAGEALEASARRLRGRLAAFGRLAWPWLALGWFLDLAGWALPDAVALALSLPSLACGLLPLVLAEADGLGQAGPQP